MILKSAVLAATAALATLGAGAAHAGGVSWSIGINAPIVAPAYPVYAPAPVYAAPVYAPVPVYEAAPPVAYYPRGAYYVGAPVIYARYGYPGWRHRHYAYRR